MESTKQEQSFMGVVKERRSVRHYDPAFNISEQELKDILTEATLAPSGANMQPWKFIVFNDQALKEQLLPIANNQQQVVNASAVIAVLGDLEYIRQVDSVYDASVEAGYMTQEVKETLVTNMKGMLASMDPQYIKDGVIFDCGLVSMQLMLAARARGYDTVAMAGYDKEKFTQAFDIPNQYVPTILIAIGKASQPGHPTTRLPIDEMTFWNGITR
ncbi:nitroreductase family protein [Paenibacillus illinoisensis]|uniref:nitroreductase family protein n=1 Tax=Paenibacillus illinoisensis TaxID=59845 RepID=UPI000FD92AA1|nr:nitroreductase family protein [Paenibacillus illinoisensis]